ncbi:hypothetical protein [Polaromonas sp. CG9_12]|nr:hypothetical protein [Polaromonas sp. CG9_12]
MTIQKIGAAFLREAQKVDFLLTPTAVAIWQQAATRLPDLNVNALCLSHHCRRCRRSGVG